MYAMETFLVSLAVYLFTKILHEKSRVGYWVAFATVLPLIFLTDYLPILILVPIWLIALKSKKNFSWWKKFLTSHIILVISAVLWLPVFLKQLTAGISVTNSSPNWVNVLGKLSFKEILLIPVKFAIGRVGFDNKILYGGVVLVIFLVFGYLFYKSVKTFKRNEPFFLWLLAPLIIALIISLKFPILSYFRFLFILPAFYILLANGIANTQNKNLKRFLFLAVLLVNIITSSMYLFNYKFHREDWRELAQEIASKPSIAVIFPTEAQQEALTYYGVKNRVVNIDKLSKSNKEVWLMRYAQPISDPNDLTRSKLESLGYKKQTENSFNGVVVWGYSKP